MGLWSYESSKAIQTLGVVTYETTCDPMADPPEPEVQEEDVVSPEPEVI